METVCIDIDINDIDFSPPKSSLNDDIVMEIIKENDMNYDILCKNGQWKIKITGDEEILFHIRHYF